MAAVSQSDIRSKVSPAFFNAIESFIMQKMDAKKQDVITDEN